MVSIKDWLNGSRNFTEGVALYLTYSDDKELELMFGQGESEYRKERLLTELRSIWHSKKAGIVAIETKHDTVSLVTAVPVNALPETKVPEVKDPYRDKWMPLYQDMNYLRHHLTDEGLADEQRGKMAFQILDLERTCIYWWNIRDLEIRTGEKTVITEEDPLALINNTNELRAKLMNLRTYRTKWKNKLEKAPESKKAKEKHAFYDMQIWEIEEKLDIKRKP